MLRRNREEETSNSDEDTAGDADGEQEGDVEADAEIEADVDDAIVNESQEEAANATQENYPRDENQGAAQNSANDDQAKRGIL